MPLSSGYTAGLSGQRISLTSIQPRAPLSSNSGRPSRLAVPPVSRAPDRRDHPVKGQWPRDNHRAGFDGQTHIQVDHDQWQGQQGVGRHPTVRAVSHQPGHHLGKVHAQNTAPGGDRRLGGRTTRFVSKYISGHRQESRMAGVNAVWLSIAGIQPLRDPLRRAGWQRTDPPCRRTPSGMARAAHVVHRAPPSWCGCEARHSPPWRPLSATLLQAKGLTLLCRNTQSAVGRHFDR